MPYLEPDIINDEVATSEAILVAIAERIEGWQAEEGTFENPIAEAIGIAIATAVTVLKEEIQNAYLGFGLRVTRLQQKAAKPATVPSTWANSSESAVEVEAGEEVNLTLPDGSSEVFVVESTVVIEPTASTEVHLVALEAGSQANNATNPAETDLLDLEVAINGVAKGGQDAETPAEYADRVVERAKRLEILPIVPSDFAAMALDIDGIARCAAINLYDPSKPAEESIGHISICPLDSAGNKPASAAIEELEAYLAPAERPIAYTLHVIDHSEKDIAIVVQVRKAPEADTAAVEAAVKGAIEAFGSPANFDADENAPGKWAVDRTTKLTIFDVAKIIDGLAEVDAVTSITLNGGTEVTFSGAVTLPHLTSVTVTVE